jgi:glycerophosphoryl diester phosphodiesterase
MTEYVPPFIFAHRGASAHAPENTLAAFALAVQQGAQGIELDVHLTADGQVVIMHDDTVDATTDGRGAIASMTLEQVRKLHAHGRGGRNKAATEPIPLLSEVFDRTVPGTLIINANIEIKPAKAPELIDAVASLIAAHNAAGQVLLSSFDRFNLAYIQQRHPTLRRALLYPSSSFEGVMTGMRSSLAWITGAHALGCEAVHPFWRLASPAVIERAHLLGMDVNVWTVDDERTLRHLAALDVDGIFTNDPARACAVVATPAPVRAG